MRKPFGLRSNPQVNCRDRGRPARTSCVTKHCGVIGIFALDGSLSGRLDDGNYLPVVQSGSGTAGNLQLVADIPSHPILAGVNSFNGGSSGFHRRVTLAVGAELERRKPRARSSGGTLY